jgi:hypothetical protein
MPQLFDLAFQFGDRLFEVEEIMHDRFVTQQFAAGTPGIRGKTTANPRTRPSNAAFEGPNQGRE